MPGNKKAVEDTKQKVKKTITVGVVRPISGYDDERDFSHWENVEEIIRESLSVEDEHYCFEVKLVSEGKNGEIIMSTIIQNLHDNDVIICDLSTQNANVFFELGIRMAYQKPCFLLVDNKTTVPFDISSVRHCKYPSTLHYVQVKELKKEIKKNVIEVHQQFKADKTVSYSPIFTKNKVTQANMTVKDISMGEDIEIKLNSIINMMNANLGMINNFDGRINELEYRYIENKLYEDGIDSNKLAAKRARQLLLRDYYNKNISNKNK